VAGTFTTQEGLLSSAARKVIGYIRSMDVAWNLFDSTLCGSTVLLQGDSQAALAAILRKFASPVPFIHEELKRLFQICSIHAFDIVPCWILRENLTEADEFSRRPDALDWGCTSELTKLICRHFNTTIDIDLASPPTFTMLQNASSQRSMYRDASPCNLLHKIGAHSSIGHLPPHGLFRPRNRIRRP
jgi:hypothetical protein